MKKLLPLFILVSLALAACRAPESASRAVVSRVVITAVTEKNERTVAPSEIVAPSYFEAKLEDGDNVYNASCSDGNLVFSNVFVGDYTIEVYGYEEKGGQRIWESSGEDKISVTVNGSNTKAIQMYVINTEGKGTVSVVIDWEDAVKTSGLVKDAYEISPFTFELVRINEDSNDKVIYPRLTAPDKATSFTYVNNEVPVSKGFTGYFNIYYTKDSKEFLLMQTASTSFQVYAGQTSQPDDQDKNLFIITPENLPAYSNPVGFSLSYGEEDPETSIKVSWSNANGRYSEIYLSCSNGETHVLDTSAESYLFEDLEKATSYDFTMYAKTKLGKETEKLTKTLATKVFVTSISFSDDDIPDTYITAGDNFILEAAVLPENASDRKVIWETSDSEVLNATSSSDTAAIFYSGKPGIATIKATAEDKGIDGSTISYESSKKITVYLSQPKAPELIIEDNEISKEIHVSWAAVPYASEYELYRNGVLLATLSETEYRDNKIIAGESYSYAVKALNDEFVTDAFNPASEMSESSEAITPVVPTITLVTPKISNLRLEINPGEDIERGAITVTPDNPVTINIPEAIEGADKYEWWINGTRKIESTDFAEVNAVILTSDMPEVQDYDKDANSLMLKVRDADGNWHSASAYFRVILVKDTGVSITMDDYYPVTAGTIKFNAHVLPEDATMQTLSYSSDNEEIASIDSDGLITIKKYGSVTFSAESASGVVSTKTIAFYEPITDASELLNIINKDINSALHKADSKFGGDWWQVTAAGYSGDGYSVNSSSKTSQSAGSMSISSRSVSSEKYGEFVFSTTAAIEIWAYDPGGFGQTGYLGTDSLQYVGHNSRGAVTVTLPYNQGNAIIAFDSINVRDKSGRFKVTMPGKGESTLDYNSVNAIF